METVRKIIHIDMDAFYASVEQRDQPELRGKPVVVGGDPDKRGVVAACSYEARRYGIHSAMSCARARVLCPHVIFLRPRFDAYKAVSRQIRQLFFEYTDLVEPLSLDEAYLDVTSNKKNIPSATQIAIQLKQQIYHTTRLTASAGVSFNKFLAKMASDYQKPNGITVITPQQANAFIDNLPIGKFHGIGKVTEKRMRALGIHTGRDLKSVPKETLTRIFGKAGAYFHDIAHGTDHREVCPHWIRKSLGKEVTLETDIDDVDEMIRILSKLAEKIAQMAKDMKIRGRTLTLKVKYDNFQCVNRSITQEYPFDTPSEIMTRVRCLLADTQAGQRKVRLLGISISNFCPSYVQLPLPFDGWL